MLAIKKIGLFFLLISGSVVAQHPLHLNFQFVNQNSDLALGQVVSDLTDTKYRLTEAIFYISNLKIEHDGGQLLDFGDSVFYVNIKNPIIDLGIQNLDQVDSLSFFVGIPANLNHTDIAAYPENHPMSFKTPSMHWGWTAGYFFFVVDGYADTDNDNVPNEFFQLHCMGDQNFKYVKLANKATISSDGKREIFQRVNMDVWLKGVDLKTLGAQHGSTGVNYYAMRNVESFPVFTAPWNASVNTLTQYVGSLKCYDSGNGLEISWEGMKTIGKLELYTASGQLVQAVNTTEVSAKRTFANLASGSYIVRILSENNQVLHQMNTIQP